MFSSVSGRDGRPRAPAQRLLLAGGGDTQAARFRSRLFGVHTGEAFGCERARRPLTWRPSRSPPRFRAFVRVRSGPRSL